MPLYSNSNFDELQACNSIYRTFIHITHINHGQWCQWWWFNDDCNLKWTNDWAGLEDKAEWSKRIGFVISFKRSKAIIECCYSFEHDALAVRLCVGFTDPWLWIRIEFQLCVIINSSISEHLLDNPVSLGLSATPSVSHAKTYFTDWPNCHTFSMPSYQPPFCILIHLRFYMCRTSIQYSPSCRWVCPIVHGACS